jgi:SAM-dependent methyltransferase
VRMLVAPYARLARAYDAALGISSFRHTRRAFARLARHYGIRFRTAADLGCGTGIFARHLARCWRAEVFGVDRSPAMLREACARQRGERVHLLLQDLRRLCLPLRVDLVTANFDTLNHLVHARDLRTVFSRVAAHLVPGGWFVFDLITPCRPPAEGRQFMRTVRCGVERVAQRVTWDAARSLLRIRVTVDGPAANVTAVEEHMERAWKPALVARLLMDTGFIIRGVHDAHTLAPAVRCPPRIIVVAQRRAGEQPSPNT